MRSFKNLNNSEKLFAVLVSTVLCMVVWAALFQVDKSIQAAGEISPLGKPVVIQARLPGAVRAINHRVNDHVQAQQVLLTIDAEDERARLFELQTELLNHQVRIRRAEAQLKLQPLFEAQASDPSDLVGDELIVLTSSLLSLQEDQLMLDKEIEALQSDIQRKSAELRSLRSAIELAEKKLELTDLLVQKGYEGQIALLEARQRLEAAQAQRSDAVSALNTMRAQLSVFQVRKQLLLSNHQKVTSAELSALRSAATSLQAQIDGLQDRIDGYQVQAQVDGLVSKLLVRFVGQVVSAGEPLAEIIPANTPLVFYARVPVASIQDVRLQQPVKLFLSNMNTRSTVPLMGDIYQIDPDATLNEQTGERFFTAVVKIQPNQPNQPNLQFVVPGVTGSAAILVGKRTVLGYLIDPLWAEMRSALNEPN